MKIGIFGGSFNPPHKTHEKIALDLISGNYLDKVIYVPTGNRYQKKDLVDAFDRFNMLKLIVDKNKNFEISDFEIKNDLTYTYQTLDYFKNLYPDDLIYFICGTDNLKDFVTWKNYEYILNMFKILVIKRNDEDVESLLKMFTNYQKNIIISNVSSDQVSSTFIRKLLKEEKDASQYLDEHVLEYIKEKKLYR